MLCCKICEVFKNTFFTGLLFTVIASVCSENLGEILVPNNQHIPCWQVLLIYRKNPRKWNCGWNKFRAEDLHRTYCKVANVLVKYFWCQQDQRNSYFWRNLSNDVSCIMTTYPFLVTSVKNVSLGCYQLSRIFFYWRLLIYKKVK